MVERLQSPQASAGTQPLGLRLATAAVAILVLLLPLMMGNRNPFSLTASLLALTSLSLVAVTCASFSTGMQALPRSWMAFASLMSVTVLIQVLPWPLLVDWFGPYPDAVRAITDVQPLTWSPDPGASLRGWAAFIALFGLAWIAYAVPRRLRYWIWLAVVGSALFQATYGLMAYAFAWDSIFGIWERHTTRMPHGSFSNRNLFAAYMALTWPLAVAVWHVQQMPLLSRLPSELKLTGSLVSAGLIGVAMLGTTSRLGSAAGLFGMLVMLILWSRNRDLIHGPSLWSAYLAAAVTAIFALWFGIMPLAERVLETGADDLRFELFLIVIKDFPSIWFAHGIGLGGLEAVFKQYQPASIGGWVDYLHSDLLQWLIEMGLVGVLLLILVVAGVLRRFRLNSERVALYSGLAALCVVALGDFSWHIPATQAVLALYLGALLAPARRRRSASGKSRGRRRSDHGRRATI